MRIATHPEAIKHLVKIGMASDISEHIKMVESANESLIKEKDELRFVAEDNKRECEATRIENARLKAEVERLTLENSQYEEHHKYGQNVITSLREEVERLTKEGDILQKCCEHQKNRIERLKQNEQLIDAGNALHDAAKIAVKWGVTATQMGMPRALYDACRNWNAAKEGKQS